MSTDTVSSAKQLCTRKRLANLLIALLGIGGFYLAFFGEKWIPHDRMGWWQILCRLYPSFWPTWVSEVLWITATGFMLAWFIQFKKTQAVTARTKSWFSIKFSFDPIFIETLHRRWDTKLPLKFMRWSNAYLQSRGLDRFIRMVTIVVAVSVSFGLVA